MLGQQTKTAGESFDCGDGIVQGSATGSITWKVWSGLFTRMLALSAVYRTRALLIDLRESCIPTDAFNVYQLPPALEYIGLSRFYTIAFLVNENNRDLAFYETVFLNHGFRLKIFTDHEEARSWLTECHATSPLVHSPVYAA